MAKLDSLDDQSVNTDKIISVYKSTFTKFVEKEPRELNDAVINIKKFLAKKTPKWAEEPLKDELGKIIKDGNEQLILYQFTQEGMIEFDGFIMVVDKAMNVIPKIVIHLRKQLKEQKDDKSSMMMPFPEQYVKPLKQEESKISKLNPFRNEKEEHDESDLAMEAQIRFVNDVRMRYERWKEWYYGAIKQDTNVVSWSDIYSRDGMEKFRVRLQEFFNYWLSTRIMMIHQYAMDLKLDDLTDDTNDFVKSLARMQHENQMLNPMGNNP